VKINDPRGGADFDSNWTSGFSQEDFFISLYNLCSFVTHTHTNTGESLHAIADAAVALKQMRVIGFVPTRTELRTGPTVRQGRPYVWMGRIIFWDRADRDSRQGGP
jgi:hypothetical protein